MAEKIHLTENDLKSDVLEIEKRRFLTNRPRLDYKPGRLASMPRTIDPDNWTEITPEEMRAHQERLSINGKLRREMWMKAYNPQHYKHFNHVNSDMAFLRYGRLRTVWHIKDTVNPLGKLPLLCLAAAVGFIGLHAWGYCHVDKYHERHETIFDKIDPKPRPSYLKIFDWQFAPSR